MKYHLITYGCQMNKSDSERIAGFLRGLGWQEVTASDEADLVILNTCSVRQSAEDRVFGQIRNLSKLKKTKPDLLIAVTGCLPGRDKENKLRQKMPAVDLYFPIADLAKLPEMIMLLRGMMSNDQGRLFCCSGRGQEPLIRQDDVDYLSVIPQYQNIFSVFVPIQTGCNNFCAYCVVPYARGREKNRSVKSILEEVKKISAKGCLEVTLLGQTVNSYKAPDPENFSARNPFFKKIFDPSTSPVTAPIAPNCLAALLWEINQIEGVGWVNFTAPDPRYMTDDLIAALNLPKQINYLHLPVQTGSDSVLKRMNRQYTREKYLEIIRKVRNVRPRIALGTDIIVGFPGETEEDFRQTADLYRQVDFDIAYLAKYSPRSGTPAYKMADDVSREEKEKRWQVLQNLMEETVLRKNQIYVGKIIEVLVERSESGLCMGHSKEMKFCQLSGEDNLIGKMVRMQVSEAAHWVLKGRKVD